MSKKQLRFTLIVLLAALTLARVDLRAGVMTEFDDDYTLTWSATTGGRGTLTGEDYTLVGVTGEIVEADTRLEGDDYALDGGIPVVDPLHRVYLPLTVK